MRTVLRSSLLALCLVVLGAKPASADHGSRCGPLSTPPCTILRPLPATAQLRADADAPECVVTVGGLGSRTDVDDGFFRPLTDPLTHRIEGRPYEVLRFGVDRGGEHSFDTYGAISQNAFELRALVRDLADECHGVDVVAHSMGGAVADRAFSLGLGAPDGVLTYLPLSAPHNGSFAARAVGVSVDLSGSFADLLSAATTSFGLHDPTSAAVRDLAKISPPRPPRVETVRQRMASDISVLRQDSADRRVDVREYLVTGLDQLEGHSGIVNNPYARSVVERTIRDHAVPAETRSVAQVKLASVASRLVEEYVSGLESVAGLGLASAAVASSVGAGEGLPTAELIDHAPEEAAMVRAALGLRQPFPLRLLRILLEAAFE